MKSFVSSFNMGGSTKKRNKKKKAAAKKQQAAAPPEAPLPAAVQPPVEVVKPDDKVESMPRFSEITATPSEDTGDEYSLDGMSSVATEQAASVAPSEADEGLLDEVVKAPEEPAEDQNDLIFDVSTTVDSPVQIEPEVAPEPEIQVESEAAVAPATEENFVQVSARDIILPSPKVNVIPVSQAVYGTVKKVWSFGTKIPLLNIWMGVTHHVAEKVVGVVGQELNSVDHGIEQKLAELDFHVSRVLGR